MLHCSSPRPQKKNSKVSPKKKKMKTWSNWPLGNPRIVRPFSFNSLCNFSSPFFFFKIKTSTKKIFIYIKKRNWCVMFFGSFFTVHFFSSFFQFIFSVFVMMLSAGESSQKSYVRRENIRCVPVVGTISHVRKWVCVRCYVMLKYLCVVLKVCVHVCTLYLCMYVCFLFMCWVPCVVCV